MAKKERKLKVKIGIMVILLMFLLMGNISIARASSNIITGECGDEATYSIDESSGTLTISGKGSVYINLDYDWDDEDDPTYKMLKKINKLVINRGITEIKNGGLSDFEWLTQIQLPNGITTIGKNSFSLGGDGNTYTKINLPSSLISIGSRAFSGGNFESITIPMQVSDLGEDYYDAFEGANVKNFYVDEDNDYFCSIAGNLYNKKATKLIRYATLNDRKEIDLPLTLENIWDWAFENSINLRSVTMSDNVEIIGYSAFAHCTNLEEISLSNKLVTIWPKAFYECENLKKIELPNTVNTIMYEAFRNCLKLEEIYIPRNCECLGYPWEEGFADCVFAGCTSLKAINVDENCDNYKSVNGNLYNKSMTELYQYAVGKSEKEFTVPNSVQKVCEGAFEGSAALKIITLPSSVNTVYCGAFQKCSALSALVIQNKNCKIEEAENEGYRGFVKDDENNFYGLVPSQTIIYGYSNSGIETIAKEYNRKFDIIGNFNRENILKETIDSGKDNNKNENGNSNNVINKTKADNNSKNKVKDTVKRPVRVSLSKVKNVKGKKAKISWKKVTGANGYQIQYALNKKFTKNKKSTVTAGVSKTVKKLKKKKTYYFRVRAYKISSTGKVYGSWSKVKKVKIKK